MKKAICIILIATLFLSACGTGTDPSRAEESGANKAAAPAGSDPAAVFSGLDAVCADMEEALYSKEYYAFPGGFAAEGMARLDSSLFMYGSSADKGLFAMAEYSVDAAGEAHIGEARLIELDAPDSIAEKNIYAVCAGENGFFYAVTGEPAARYLNSLMELCENADYQGRYALLKFSPSGSLVSKTELSLPELSSVSGIVVDKTGRAVLYSGRKIICLEPDGTTKSAELERNASLCGGALFGERVILKAYYDSPDIKSEYLSYSPETGELAPFTIYNEDNSVRELSVTGYPQCQGLNGEYIICDDSSYFYCEPGENVCHELFRWYYGFYSLSNNYVCRLSEKSFIYSVLGENFFVVTGMAQRAKTEKTVVNVALYNMGFPGAESILDKVNSLDSEYEYIGKSYSADELNRLSADLSSDTPPDLVLFGSNLNTATAAFENLYPYIDADPELTRESFIPNFLEALSVNGELHELWPTVTVNTLAARVSDVGDGAGLRAGDYESIAANSDRYTAVFQTFMSGENLLKWTATLGVSIFVDKDNGTCSFDTPAFYEMLEWCAHMGEDVPEGGSAPSLDISEVLLSVESISAPIRMKAIRENFGEPYVFVGFPLDGGHGSFYSNTTGRSMAIPTASRNKDGAWAYIRAQLIESAQQRIKWDLPVNLAALRRMAEAELTDDECTQLIQLLNDTKYAENSSDSVARDIIMECGRAYLAGDKTLEETVNLIQSRVSIYLAEQYG